MTDFGMFIYLDTVEPGDGGLLLVHGSHRATLERPPEVGGTYGSGNWPVNQHGVREKGATPLPHADEVPPHFVVSSPKTLLKSCEFYAKRDNLCRTSALARVTL